MTHHVKYFVVFWAFYLGLATIGALVTILIFRHTDVNAGPLVNIFAFFASLGAALRTGDGIFPHQLDASHVRVAADIRARGVMLAVCFGAIALASDLTIGHSLSLAYALALPIMSAQKLLALFGIYVLMALIVLNYEQRDDPAA